MNIATNIESILRDLGENPEREGLKDTPQRVEKAWEFLCSGYKRNLTEVVGGALFKEESTGMVLIRDIEVYSMCEHHLLPFYGKAHVGYLPRGRVIGLSKVPRIVEMFARRLQVQERLTDQIGKAVREVLQPLGVAVVLKCKHMCMMMRGVEKQNSEVFTSYMDGAFEKEEKTRIEFLDLIRTGSQ
ncbi:MAG: GTP cyclohydrolase I FolE [Spirochaetales bacterium]|nr:GTP cyclohydrolase I FolE [Spirochaetales bacterium]